MRHLFLFGLFLFLTCPVHAYMSIPLDSIGIEKVGEKTFIIHQVAQGETLFGLSRRYNVAVNDILQSNASLQDGLKMGVKIRIPFISQANVSPSELIHKVAAGETLFAISRKYNVSVNDILAWNNLQGSDISVGQSLRIQRTANTLVTPAVSATPAQPITSSPVKSGTESGPPTAVSKSDSKRGVSTEPTLSNSPTTVAGEWISHTVEQGETLFAISRKYEAPMSDLITWNNLASNNLQTGQKLKVGRVQVAKNDIPVVKATVPVKVNNERVEGKIIVEEPDTTGDTAFKDIKETGLAEVIDGTGNHKKYLVLHRTAPVGTIMRVRNEENDITIFARVVGKLPDTGDNSRLIIKLSKAAYDQLKAVNSRFPVEISY